MLSSSVVVLLLPVLLVSLALSTLFPDAVGRSDPDVTAASQLSSSSSVLTSPSFSVSRPYLSQSLLHRRLRHQFRRLHLPVAEFCLRRRSLARLPWLP